MNDLTVINEIEADKKGILEMIMKMKSRDEKLANSLFGNMDDICFGEVYNTFCHSNEKLRSCVYFIKNEYNGLIKIGMTTNLPARMKQLESNFYQCGMQPKLKIIMLHLTFPKFAKQLETSYHIQYKKHRKYGEWFDISTDEITDINNFGDGLDRIDDVLICFEEAENLITAKSKDEFQIEPYAHRLLGSKTYDDLAKAGILPDYLKVWFSIRNKTLDLLFEIREKQDLCVKAIALDRVWLVGNLNEEPLSFSELKRQQFYIDYQYWANILGNLTSTIQ